MKNLYVRSIASSYLVSPGIYTVSIMQVGLHSLPRGLYPYCTLNAVCCRVTAISTLKGAGA